MPLPSLDQGLLPEGCHECHVEEVEGLFCEGAVRQELWSGFVRFAEYLRVATSFRHVYLDGRFISAETWPETIDVGIELPESRRYPSDLLVIDFKSRYGVNLILFAPHRPLGENFHHAFQIPDYGFAQERSLPPHSRKGYLRVLL
ncbi:hypothetical protein SAMN05444156_2595 [Verrucomicrobium sp. GAS474]|uniref:DUF6932 family protein n=1 Tax=Verrucomicrobium sp. GAS474 TaxID=1882831 RepID=UPI000879F647|nr:hypothetical protein [Verrucomicrobium sp. GAS474]SDU20549.1 hypothetical protein SAMN05444156_2595 [Verrucomicrobium sp. GAS474]